MKKFLTGREREDKQLLFPLTLAFFLLASVLRAAPVEMPVFSPVWVQLRQKSPSIPILLPTFIARSKQFGPLAPEWRITHTSYSIGLGDALKRPISRDFPFPRQYFSVYGQAIRMRQAPRNGKRVALADGITGWYSPSTSKASDTSGIIGWRYKTGDYSMGLVQGTEAELVAMANSAIQHPVQLQPAAPSRNTDFVDHNLRFRHGSDTVVINGTMTPGIQMDVYTLKAHKGQTLAVRVKSPDKRVFFAMMTPVFDVNRDDDLLYWYLPIKVPGDYIIRVIADKYGVNKTCTYTLQVKLSGR